MLLFSYANYLYLEKPLKIFGTLSHWFGLIVSDLRQVCGFLLVLRFPPPIKLTATI
jgi:hypothetical protein